MDAAKAGSEPETLTAATVGGLAPDAAEKAAAVLDAAFRVFAVGAPDVATMNETLRINADMVRALEALDPDRFADLRAAVRRRRIECGFPPDPPSTPPSGRRLD